MGKEKCCLWRCIVECSAGSSSIEQEMAFFCYFIHCLLQESYVETAEPTPDFGEEYEVANVHESTQNPFYGLFCHDPIFEEGNPLEEMLSSSQLNYSEESSDEVVKLDTFQSLINSFFSDELETPQKKRKVETQEPTDTQDLDNIFADLDAIQVADELQYQIRNK